MTNDELEALIRRKLAFVMYCESKAARWRKLSNVHSEKATQLNNELKQRLGQQIKPGA